MHHLVAVCNKLNGHPYRVWRVGTDLGEERSGTIWSFMREQECVAIGWPLVGDLSALSYNKESKIQLAGVLAERHDMTSNIASRKAGEILRFACHMERGDLVLAASGQQILGVGRVADSYRFDPQAHEDVPHQRKVDWQ